MKNYFFLFGFLLAAATGCKKEQDTTAPTFEIVSLTPDATTALVCGASSDNVIPIIGGNPLAINFRLTDDTELGQYKIDIHDDFDCHGHEGERTTMPDIWELVDVVDISGTDESVSRALDVPAEVRAGDYHFQISVLDAAGNINTNTPIYTLRIQNPSDLVAPTLTRTAPADNDFSLSRGTTMQVAGSLGDNLSLDGATLELSYETPTGDVVLAYNRLFAAADFVGQPTNTEYNYAIDFVLPATLAAGEHHFTLILRDAVGNKAETDFHVEVD